MSSERSRSATAAQAVRARAICVRLTRAFFLLAAQLEILWTMHAIVRDLDLDAEVERQLMQKKVDALLAMSATWAALALRGDIKYAAEDLRVELHQRDSAPSPKPTGVGVDYLDNCWQECAPPSAGPNDQSSYLQLFYMSSIASITSKVAELDESVDDLDYNYARMELGECVLALV